jgi:hypothetical protein
MKEVLNSGQNFAIQPVRVEPVAAEAGLGPAENRDQKEDSQSSGWRSNGRMRYQVV